MGNVHLRALTTSGIAVVIVDRDRSTRARRREHLGVVMSVADATRERGDTVVHRGSSSIAVTAARAESG